MILFLSQLINFYLYQDLPIQVVEAVEVEEEVVVVEVEEAAVEAEVEGVVVVVASAEAAVVEGTSIQKDCSCGLLFG